ncbi:Outer membrane protein beta-barrel domain-containing protein [Paracoccus aminovorans]|uniref:Outer membrane protein beta-barrel domain-containing protein n=1 Tax=Paracoccus aminovorans TaxID=34004 RepID=A0A1I2YVQ3_9RHOB|nr:hypothetical protein [Paracoccus aminovorans]CQR85798.1 hypothetical protein JCM7685_1222 [Paracoccus aminovorans]SFH29747.1 Outer membrane protein beta-barrel domain-containing protein [Paracoccus aminovorans]
MRGFLAAAAAALSTGLAPAMAQDWSGQITPYVWGAGLGGDVTPFAGAPTLSFDKSLSEVLEDTDGAFFLSGFARRDRLVLMGDFSWSSSSKAGVLPPGVPAEGKVTQRSLTLLAGWRVVSNDRMTLDALAGARAWRVESRIKVAGGAIQASPGKDFIDPILALRANVALAPQWSAILYADVGGFGAGSEHTSQFLATVNYQVTDQLYVSGGYRQLNVDYRDGGTRLDVTMAGPILGATWRF